VSKLSIYAKIEYLIIRRYASENRMHMIRMLKLWQKQNCNVDENNTIYHHVMLNPAGFLPVIITETSVTFCIYVNLIIINCLFHTVYHKRS